MASLSYLLLLALSLVQHLVRCSPQGESRFLGIEALFIANESHSVALASVSQSAEFLQSAAPDLAGPTTAAASCGGCYLVADVSTSATSAILEPMC